MSAVDYVTFFHCNLANENQGSFLTSLLQKILTKKKIRTRFFIYTHK